jgi:hypothetical protein
MLMVGTSNLSAGVYKNLKGVRTQEMQDVLLFYCISYLTEWARR